MLQQRRGRVPSPRCLRLPRTALAGGSLVLAGAAFLVAETVAARSWAHPRYTYVGRYVSDLGVPAATTFASRQIVSPRHAVMNAGFIAQGVLATTAGLTVTETVPRGRRTPLRLLASAYGLAMVGVGVFHGADASSRLRHGLHGGGASLAIVSAAVAALLVGTDPRGDPAPSTPHRVSNALGVTALAAGLAVPVAHGSPVVGLVQRSSLYAVTGWQLLAGTYLVEQARRDAARRTPGAGAPSRIPSRHG